MQVVSHQVPLEISKYTFHKHPSFQGWVGAGVTKITRTSSQLSQKVA